MVCPRNKRLMTADKPTLPVPIATWFAARGWAVRRHQLEMMEAAAKGEHVLLTAPTGAGKTLAGFLPVLAELAEGAPDGLHTLYVSPLKALAVDVRRNLLAPIEDMALPIRVEARTGDTPSDRKKRQRENPPHILLTTPESLSLLLSYPDSLKMFAGLKTIIIDEVHAFAPSKRGDLLALCIARLGTLAPAMRRVALSATVSDPGDYLDWLSPQNPTRNGEGIRFIVGDTGAPPNVTILIPEDRIPWGGHSGKYAAAQVMAAIEAHGTTLVFCNTRGLAELIFQELWSANELKLPIGIHHGSLDVRRGAKWKARWPTGGCEGLSLRPALISGWIGAMLIASSKWARLRGHRACCSALGGPITSWTFQVKP